MGDENLGLASAVIDEYLLEHKPFNVGTQGEKGVLKVPRQPVAGNIQERHAYVENLGIGGTVNGSTNIDTLPLATR